MDWVKTQRPAVGIGRSSGCLVVKEPRTELTNTTKEIGGVESVMQRMIFVRGRGINLFSRVICCAGVTTTL
jgi:hypothetical protein